MLSNADYAPLKEKALRALARREHSRFELTQKLARFSEDASLIARVLDECEKNRWLDNTRFARAYARSRSQKYYGPKKIAYELQQRGVDKTLIQAVLSSEDFDWTQLAKEAHQRKFGDKEATSWTDRAKQEQYLYQRGF